MKQHQIYMLHDCMYENLEKSKLSHSDKNESSDCLTLKGEVNWVHEAWESFLGGKEGYILDSGCSYTYVYICHNILNSTLMICVFYHISVIAPKDYLKIILYSLLGNHSSWEQDLVHYLASLDNYHPSCPYQYMLSTSHVTADKPALRIFKYLLVIYTYTLITTLQFHS